MGFVPSRYSSGGIFHALTALEGRRCIMADSKTKAGKPDRDRINVHEPYELRDWSKKFGVTPEQLKAAVAKVGVMAKDVEAELKRKDAPGTRS